MSKICIMTFKRENSWNTYKLVLWESTLVLEIKCYPNYKIRTFIQIGISKLFWSNKRISCRTICVTWHNLTLHERFLLTTKGNKYLKYITFYTYPRGPFLKCNIIKDLLSSVNLDFTKCKPMTWQNIELKSIKPLIARFS